MTSYYDQVPSLEARVSAAPVIIVGRVGERVSVQIDHYQGEPFVRSTFEVEVRDVLKGQPTARKIRVEVMGGEAENVSSPLPGQVRNGATLVLMLVSDAESDTYVPYFTSAFPVDADGTVQFGPQAANKLASATEPLRDGQISVERLRDLVATTQRRDATSAAEEVSTEQADLPPAPVSEMPGGVTGGGRNAAPEAGRAE
jgi:hypothetical protein